MKRLFVILAVAFSTLGAAAQSYENSIGAVVGTMDGISFKTFILDNLALQADVAFKYLVTGSASYVTTTDHVSVTLKGNSTFEGYIFEVNPNLMYQTFFADAANTRLAWFAGGGISLGVGEQGTVDFAQETISGKFGINAMAGIEWVFKKFPMAISVDARPGYGLFFDHEPNITNHAHVFDWGLLAGVRYLF